MVSTGSQFNLDAEENEATAKIIEIEKIQTGNVNYYS